MFEDLRAKAFVGEVSLCSAELGRLLRKNVSALVAYCAVDGKRQTIGHERVRLGDAIDRIGFGREPDGVIDDIAGQHGKLSVAREAIDSFEHGEEQSIRRIAIPLAVLCSSPHLHSRAAKEGAPVSPAASVQRPCH